jgi:hypothetical protein
MASHSRVWQSIDNIANPGGKVDQSFQQLFGGHRHGSFQSYSQTKMRSLNLQFSIFNFQFPTTS